MRLNMQASLPALGIDVGGGSTKIGIVSPTGEVLAENRVVSDASLPASVLIDQFLHAADQLQQSLKVTKLCGIGIGLPGNIDFLRGTTRLCNVAALDEFPIVEYIGKKSSVPIHIENDATLAAIAEYRFGVGQGSNRFLTVALGTGIGVGFIENGKPVHTANGTMGDMGHVIVDPSGKRACQQGCHGCLESVASAVALEERYQGNLASLFASARLGDAVSADMIADAAKNIGAAVVSWMHIFAPDRIAFAGGVSAAGEDLLEPVRKTVMRLALPDYAAKVTILLASLGSKAGMVGAAALCFPNQNNERVHT